MKTKLKNFYNQILIIFKKSGVSITLIASLVFFGIQLKHNIKATRSSTANAIVNTMADWYIVLGSSPEFAKSFYNYMANADTMTERERFPFLMYLHAIFLVFQNSYYLSQAGTLDSHIESSFIAVLKYSKKQQGLLLYWEKRRATFDKEFQKYVDNIISSKDEKNFKGVFQEIE